MKKKIFLLCALCLFVMPHILQAEECEPPKAPVIPCNIQRPFLYVGGGYAWSRKASLEVDPAFWESSPQGYDGDLGNSEFYTLGAGYHFNPLFSMMLEATYRPSFEYKRFQTSTAVATPGFLGTKTRHFRFDNWAVLVDAFLNKQGDYWQIGGKCGCFAPFVGAGVGISYNTVKDFHSVLPRDPITTFMPVRSIMPDFTKISWAGQLMAGFVSRVTPFMTFEIGYRRFFGGRFWSNRYFDDVPSGLTSSIIIPAWRGTFQANELFVGLCYTL